MGNLNAEQVKNKLEQLSLEMCMTGVTIKGYSVVHLLRDALALINSQEQRIKELAEENERLRLKDAENAESAFRDTAVILGLQQRLKKTTEENERLRADNEIKSQKRANIFEITNAFERGRTDGVRKMQERLKADAVTIQDHTGKLGVVVGVGNIDDVAKEMMEGENEG